MTQLPDISKASFQPTCIGALLCCLEEQFKKSVKPCMNMHHVMSLCTHLHQTNSTYKNVVQKCKI